MGWGRGEGDKVITFTCLPVDWRYLRLMGIEILEGRDFQEHDGDVYIINEAARRRWPWVEMDKPLIGNDLNVVGVCSNIRYASIHQDRDNEPVAFVILGEKYAQWGDRLGVVNIRIAKGVDKREKRQQIQDRLRKMSGTNDLDVRFLDQQLQHLYEEEFRFIHQILALTILTLLITLIGVFCLTLFETEYRRKEIGIRKIMGSTSAITCGSHSQPSSWLPQWPTPSALAGCRTSPSAHPFTGGYSLWPSSVWAQSPSARSPYNRGVPPMQTR